MVIEIDDKSGFCFGAVNAITQAEKLIETGRTVYSLGDIVHNRVEVQRLEASGLITVQHDNLEQLHDATMLIRAHGEPPSTYGYAERNGIDIVDATCPVVARLQKVITMAYQKMKPIGGQVVLLGKRGHAEVVGLIGQVDGDVIVVEKIDDLEAVDFARPIYLLSQTTQSLDLFHTIRDEIMVRSTTPEQVIVHDTICRQVSNRGPHLREFAARFDVIIFVSGRKSSNGKVLFGICREANSRSFNVEDESEIDMSWFENCSSIGICGATSTPKWLMTRVADTLKKRCK